MDNYILVSEKQRELFEQYHHWYRIVNTAKSTRHLEAFRQIFKRNTRIFKMSQSSDSVQDIKKILYKEIKRLTAIKHLAWINYRNHLRFNFFCIAAYRQTHVDVSFARHMILEYLQGFTRT